MVTMWHLLNRRRLFQCGYQKARRLFEARHLLEEIWYFKENCLPKIRSRNNLTFQFKLHANPINIEPDEVYQPFVEIDQNLNYHERTLFDHRVTIVKTLLLFIMI